MWKLLVRCGEAGEADIPVAGELSIGREAGNAIWLDDALVSRRHARLVLRGDDLIVEDLDSANGVFRNGERVNGSAILRPGDALVIGATTLLVTWTASDTTAARRVRPLDQTASFKEPCDEPLPRKKPAKRKEGKSGLGCALVVLATPAFVLIWLFAQ